MDVSDGVWFTLLYALLCLFIMAPTKEVVDMGFTLPQVFVRFLHDPEFDFVLHHMHRTSLNTLVHSLLPLGYVLGVKLFADISNEDLIPMQGNVWAALLVVSVVIAGIAINRVGGWIVSDWLEHPTAKVLATYAAQTGGTWRDVAFRVNTEYWVSDKFVTSGAINKVVLLPSWLIQIGPYDMKIIHTADARLKVVASTEHRVSHLDSTGLQCLVIQVESQRPTVPSFVIQVNSSEYDQFRHRMPLENVKNIPIHRNLSDRFIDTFRSMISQNPELEVQEEQEVCIGCMQETADVALRKSCDDESNRGAQRCTGCLCRPLWCSSCLARWFAARQDQDMPYTWLMGKCPCPTCRSVFCLLDVRPLVTRTSRT